MKMKVKKKLERKVLKINKRYEKFFFEGIRATSAKRKGVLVLHEEKIDEFFKALVEDKNIPDLNKLLIGLSLSGGLRVSEALNLKKENFDEEDGAVFGNSIVLKTKIEYELRRDFMVYPRLVPMLEKLLKRKKPHEKIFRERATKGAFGVKKIGFHMSRSKALYAIKKYLGEGFDSHSLRHSNVSILMNSKHTDIEISKMLELSVRMVANYSHVNTRKKMRELYDSKSKIAA
jgi:integrase